MPARQALEGIRIADFTWFGVGPITTRFLAHFGAQVIKLESSARLDGLRQAAPYAGGSPGYNLPHEAVISNVNLSGYFNDYNSNKLSLQVNLSLPKGREVARRLIAISDVVVDNFTPRVMENWGFSYEDLVKIKPDIIVASIPMIGSAGPYRDHLGFGAAVVAYGGINSISGMPDDPPVGTGTNLPDYSCNPTHAAFAILAALRHRRKTGKGQHVEISQLESTVSVLETAILDYTINGRVQGPNGNSLPHACPHGAYRCKGDDRWCVIAVLTDSDWADLCRCMEREDLISDPQFSTFHSRIRHSEVVDRIVTQWTIAYAPEEVMEILQKAGVAAGIVQTAEDALEKDPQLAARGHWVYLDHSEAGRTAYDGDAFKLSLTPTRIHSAAPCLGQHTEFVCRELLDMSEQEYVALREEKVLN